MPHFRFLRPTARLLPAAFFLLCVAPIARAQPAPKPAETPEAMQAYLRENYTKYEYQIVMRDGVKLFTAVYAPKDTSMAWPILLTRTPYGLKPYGVDQYPVPRGPMANYAKEKFLFVLQDVRGRYGSEGTFSHVRPHNPNKATPQDIDESTDCFDTIDWLVKNVPNNNGKVGLMGISYPGFYTSAGMIDSHPALHCASPRRPSPIGSSATTFITTAPSICPTPFIGCRISDKRWKSRRASCKNRSTTRRPTATTSTFGWVRSRMPSNCTSKAGSPSGRS